MLQRFKAGKKEKLFLHERATHRTTELIEPQNRGTGPIEFIAGIQRIVPEVFKQAAVESVAAALGDDADLSTAPGPELRRIIAGVYPKLLYVLHAGLQPEYTVDLAADVAGVVGDDAASFNAVEAQGVLLEGPAVEAYIVEASGAEVDRARRHEVQLRDLAAVDRKFRNIARTDICPNRGGGGIDDSQRAAGHDHLRVDGGGLERHVERSLLAHLQTDAGILRRRHTARFGREGVLGRRKLRGKVHTLLVGHNLLGAAGILVFHSDGGRGNHRTRGVGNRTHNASHVILAMD